MSMTRREFIKTSAIAATASAAGVTIPGVNEALAQAQSAADGVLGASLVYQYSDDGLEPELENQEGQS